MEELTSNEKQLLREIIADLDLTEPVSFNIKDLQNRKIVVEGTDEFFNADQIRAFYNVYARYVVGLYRKNLALQEKIVDFQALLGKTEEFRKAPQRAISVDEV